MRIYLPNDIDESRGQNLIGITFQLSQKSSLETGQSSHCQYKQESFKDSQDPLMVHYEFSQNQSIYRIHKESKITRTSF